MNQQASNFIATPSWEMNKFFELLTKHDVLQYIIHVFQGTHFPYWLNEIETIVTKSK
jgi:hypothetical protein